MIHRNFRGTRIFQDLFEAKRITVHSCTIRLTDQSGQRPLPLSPYSGVT
jgi:hypothetical protein